MKTSLKKVIAVLCAIAMVVTSVTVYNARTTKASANATGNGKVYTVTDGANDGFTGFTCNGVNIFSEVDGNMSLAWGIKVDPASVKVTINGTEVTTYNGIEYGVYVAYNQFKDLADGEYPIVVTATTKEDAKAVTGNATLKIEDQGETEPAVTDPAKVNWDSISWLGNGTTDQANLDRFKAYVSPANPKKLEVINIQAKESVNAVYMPNNDSPAQKVEVNGKDITADCITDGAQTFVPVTALVGAQYNIVKITTVNANELTAFIYNKTVEGGVVETTEKPVETTEAQPTTAPGETETDGPVETSETPSETPAETSSETPSETPAETSSETPSETPAETSSETPSETPVETSTETPSETPSETSTETPSETTPVVETTTVAPTTPAQTTTAPKTTAAPKKVLKRTTVATASKKKASKKVKITFKRVKGAKKYQVQISTTKKFKKVLVKKTVKKYRKQITITSNKIRNKKKLYVRVRAVGAKKWSIAKKIKIKK